MHASITGYNLSAEEILRRNGIGVFDVVLAPDVRHVVQVSAGLGGDRIAGVVLKGNVAQQGAPIVLDHLSRGLRTGDARRGRDDSRVGVTALQIEGQSASRAVEGRGETQTTGFPTRMFSKS